MVHWYYKLKYGYAVALARDQKTRYKVDIYGGNCLCVLTSSYYAYEEGKRKHLEQFKCFFDDLKHLERCLGLRKTRTGETDNIFKNWLLTLHFNTYFKETRIIAETFAKAGYKVSLYYSVPRGSSK